MAASPLPKLAIIDNAKAETLLISAATATIIHRDTHATWKTYDSNLVLNAFYGFWKEKPGSVAIETAAPSAMKADASALAAKYISTFYSLLKKDPAAALKFLEQQSNAREQYLTSLKRTYLEAQQVNQMVDDELRSFVFFLREVKFAAEVLLATLGTAPLGYTAGMALMTAAKVALGKMGVGIGYAVAVNVVSSLSEARNADIVVSTGSAVGTATMATLTNMPSLLTEKPVGDKVNLVATTLEDKGQQMLQNARTTNVRVDQRAADLFRSGSSEKNAVKILELFEKDRTVQQGARTVASSNFSKAGAIRAVAGKVAPVLSGLSLWFYAESLKASAKEFVDASGD
jgi:hypothetical protein